MIYKIRHLYIFFTILLTLTAIGFSFWIYQNADTVDPISFTISSISLMIALMGFFIALNTFTSIDSVNKITKMEGNILENEYYVTSLASLMKEYHYSSLTETEAKIFTHLEKKFKKESKTAIEFTESLIHFVDIIVFFPALFSAADIDKPKYEQKMEKILKLMNKRKDDLISINTGNRIQMSETVKLIEGVIAYQNLVSHNKFDGDSVLLEVRGTLLRNAVTKTVYYNYLGLLYNKKAMAIIRRELGLEGKDLLDIENLIQVQQNIDKITGNERELAHMFLNDSREAFRQALIHCKEDHMWIGFIKYNDARSCFFESLFKEKKLDLQWDECMKGAIAARSKLNILITEVLKSEREPSHLQRSFQFQEELARVVRLNILIAINENHKSDIPLTYKGVDITQHTSLKNKFHEDEQYPILAKYQNHIMEYITSNHR
ncbi:hypothetical protein RYX45_14245 [Alkalihalophilus pseudofirmus]|uniref:Phage abortive infection protein n=1 Tax=Alkalihalophilus pseudofirmus TaxID=79885 RepID=A0AAJ2U389_ALKPS|nr:hypothetical protein [Alkalihalophilus pseudofirmus]MDV2886347.1 hypothetical protein [Alkalihalophilus pseudofirmus]